MKMNGFKNITLTSFITLSLLACSGQNNQPSIEKDNSSSSTENTIPLNSFDGIYFNEQTKQIALIDSNEQYPLMLQNFYDIDDLVNTSSNKEKSNITHLHLVEDLQANENAATSHSTTTWTFDNKVQQTSGQKLSLTNNGNTLNITNTENQIVSNPEGGNPTLTKQPPSRPLKELTINLKTDRNGTIWTIKEDGSFRMNLRGKCVFTGRLDISQLSEKSYYSDDDAHLNAGCDVPEIGYKEGSYSTKFYSFDRTDDKGNLIIYVATVSILNGADITIDRPIFSVIAVRSQTDPIDGVYYSNRYEELKNNPNIECNNITYCQNNPDKDKDGTYSQIVFIDVKKEPYNVVIHKALAGAPNVIGEPLLDVIFTKAVYAKDSEGNDDLNTLIATEYYKGPSMGDNSGQFSTRKYMGNMKISLNKTESETTINVIIESSNSNDVAELFDPNTTNNPNFAASIPSDGVKFVYQPPTEISKLVLPDVKDRSGVVWTLNEPEADGTGMTFWAKSPDFGDPCLYSTPKVVDGKVTNEKDYYFSDTKTTLSLDPNNSIPEAMTTNIYGFKAENGITYLSSSVIPNNFSMIPLAIAGGLLPPISDDATSLCKNN